ncbi:MAG: S9 family peptidase [Ignavibacteriaceae bacterium]|nr:S9 family peptidase [Ignavibacteriaceae bacterium]
MKAMKLSLLFLLISVSLFAQVERKEKGNLVIEGIPDIPQRIIEKMNQYQNTRSAGLSGWLPNGEGILISTRFGETAQIHHVKTPGGTRRQITFFPEPINVASINHDKSKKEFLFLKDVGGNEFAQIYLFDLKTGSYKLLTDGKSLYGGINWSNKGDKFAYYSTKRNGKDYDLYINDFSSDSKMILQVEGSWSVADWSSDDKSLLIEKSVSAGESYFYHLDIASGKLEQINPTSEKIAYGGAAFSKDGKGIFITSDQNSEFQVLKYYDLRSRQFTNLTKQIPWDVVGFTISNKGDKLAFTTNEGGMYKLYLLDTKAKKYSEIKNLPQGIIGGFAFSPDDNELAFVSNTSTTPGDIFSVNLKTNKLTRWTFSEVGGLNTENFTSPELIEYASFDFVDGKARMIPAYLFKPKNKKGPVPVIISIHGGPEGQYLPGFSSFTQFLVNELGVAVLAPNVRGSTGYGKTYLSLDNWENREKSVEDIGKLLDWIATQSDLDAKKVCVFGGSYGGYMVLSSMTHFNDRLACAIDVVGISNFVTFLENTQAYRRDLRRVEYGDERIPEMKEFLNKISPTTNANKITKPLFVVQGLNDPRVPASEAEQIVKVVRENHGSVWYLLAKDEGHGFRKKSNIDYYNNAIVLFLEEHLVR